MPEYPSLAALRSGLTTDNADERGRAYGAVLGANVQPSAVLDSDPGESTVETLVDEDVIPRPSSAGGAAAAEQREQIISLLETLVDNSGGA